MRAATAASREADIGGTHDLALAHRNAAGIWARYSPIPIRISSSSIHRVGPLALMRSA